MRHPLAFLDFETTGMSAGRDGITDIGLVSLSPDGACEQWQQLVNPGMWIPSQITALTGISNAMVAGAPEFPAVADALETRLRGALIVAHNAKFDIGFLAAGLDRCGRTRRLPHVCSVRVARKLFPALKSRSLDALTNHFGLRFEGERHRALPDAVMLRRLWFAMRDATGAELFDKTVDALTCDGPVEPEAELGTATSEPATPRRADSEMARAGDPAPGSVSPAPGLPLPSWPYAGPVVMRSTRRVDEWHVFHEWRHLGSVTDERHIMEILDTRRDTPFVHATYRKIVVALSTPGVEIRPLARPGTP